MAIPANLPFFQYTASTNRTLANGFLYSYLAGTDTPTPLYTDATGNTAHEWPLQLGPDGAASFWIDENKSYKFVLKNSSNVLQKTWDRINDDPINMVDLANNSDQTKGAALIGYDGGTVADSLAALMELFNRPYYSVANDGVVGDGSDESAGVQFAATNAASYGAVLYFPYSELGYKFSGITITGDSLSVDLNNNIITPASDERVFDFSGSFQSEVPVSSIELYSVVLSHGTVSYTAVNVADSSGFSVGDIVKVYSADEMSDGWASGAFIGEYSSVYSIVGNKIVLSSRLYDHSEYSTSIKISIINNNSFSISNGYINCNNTTSSYGLVRISSARDCEITRLKCRNHDNAFVSLENIYKYRAVGVEAYNLLDNTSISAYGYGIADSGCYGGDVVGLICHDVRHAFTNTPYISSGAPDVKTGRTIHTKIIGGVGINCKNGAWDTHPGGAYIKFIDCSAIGGDSFGQIRSPDVTFVNPVAKNVASGIFLGNPLFGSSIPFKNAKIINPDIEVTTGNVFNCYASSGTPYPSPGEFMVEGGKIKISGNNIARGCLYSARAVPVKATFNNVDLEIGDINDSPLCLIFPDDDTELIIDDMRIKSLASTLTDNFYIAQFDGDATSYSCRVVMDKVTITGETGGLRALVDRGDGLVGYANIEKAHASFAAVTNGATLSWGYSS